ELGLRECSPGTLIEEAAVGMPWQETRPLSWPPQHGEAKLGEDNGSRAISEVRNDHKKPDQDTVSGPGQLPKTVPTILNQLRGFRFLRSEGGTFLSESWRVLTPAGRERILHRFFGLSPKRAVEGLAKLHALVHPGLLPMQLLGSDGEQLLMLGET